MNESLRPRQKKFAQAYVKCGVAQRAYVMAGYSPKSARVEACRLLAKPSIQEEIKRLQQLAEDKSILTIVQRKKLLSKIAEQIGGHDPADYIAADKDGTSVKFDKESPNRMAVGGIKSRTENGTNGTSATISELKLRDPTVAVRAIDTLNRMDGVYGADSDLGGVSVTLVVQSANGQPVPVVPGRKP